MRATSRWALRSRWLLFPALALLTDACSESTSPGNPAKLAFTIQPETTTGGNTMLPIAVVVQDAKGRTVTSATSNVTLALASGPAGGSLSGTVTVSAVNGEARFTGLSIDKIGTYTLSASSPNLTSATSTSFIVTVGPPAKLAFVSQPVSTIAHVTIPGIAVAVQDPGGNTVPTATNSVIITIATNPSGGTLLGNATVSAIGGVATFANLSINNTGLGYQLRASAVSLLPATSAAFNITFGSPTQLAFKNQPLTTAPGAVMPPISVAVQDIAGNTLPGATNVVTVAIAANTGGATLSGNATVAAVNGVATFSTLSIDKAGVGYTLTAASANLIGALSSSFSIRNPLVFTMVTAAYFHSCGVATGGAAYCWGDNNQGQLGGPGGSTSGAVPVSGGLALANLAAGRDHTCGVSTGGGAYCWGSNNDGKLGVSLIQQSPAPIAVSGGAALATAIAGYAHSCGLTANGAAYCWGANGAGELGNGSPTSSVTPVAVSGGLAFSSLSVGRLFTCGLTTMAVGYCWGDNFFGELGDGSRTSRTVPVPLSGTIKLSSISAGGFHACGLDLTGVAYCWGANDFGQLGFAGASSNTPAIVSGGLKFTALTAGNRHNCGLTSQGVAYCWGDNSNANLGNGTTTNSSTPSLVAGGLKWISISAGRFHTCGVTDTGVAYCWGQNVSGELGDGTTERRTVPVPVR